MKNIIKNDKFTSSGLTVITLLFLMFVAYLFSFLLIKAKIEPFTSDIPSLDKGRLDQVYNDMQTRHDIDSKGRPDITKFSFGNDEPFK